MQQRGHRGLQSRASGLPGWPQPWLKGGCLHLLLGRTLRLKPELAKLGNKYLKPGRTAYEPGQRVVSPLTLLLSSFRPGGLRVAREAMGTPGELQPQRLGVGGWGQPVSLVMIQAQVRCGGLWGA